MARFRRLPRDVGVSPRINIYRKLQPSSGRVPNTLSVNSKADADGCERARRNGCGKSTNGSKTKGESVQVVIATTNAVDNSIRVGDDYEALRTKIISVGGAQTDYPDDAPIGTGRREPVVDDKGHTNWVSDEVDPYTNRRVFSMKDGRTITVTLDGSKVSAVRVEPAMKAND
jgi:hypothetical protein